jgi:hypothetical protein
MQKSLTGGAGKRGKMMCLEGLGTRGRRQLLWQSHDMHTMFDQDYVHHLCSGAALLSSPVSGILISFTAFTLESRTSLALCGC